MVEQLQSRQDLLQSAWAGRDRTITELRRLLEQLEPGASHHEVTEVIQALDASRSADEIGASPVLLRWLPNLLPGKRNAFDSTSTASQIPLRIQRLAMATQQSRLARRLWLYPLVLLVAMASVFVFFCLAIIPTIRDFFMDFGLQLPASTQLLFDFSLFLQSYPWWMFAAILAMVTVLGMVVIFWPQWLLGYHGPLDRAMESLMGGRTASKIEFWYELADLISAGVQPDFALRYSLQRQSAGPTSLSRELTSVQVQRSLAKLPACFHNVVEVDDESGWKVNRVDVDGLRDWAVIHENRLLRLKSQRWLAVASFLLKVTAGFMVGYLVTAIYGPITQLISGLT
jgi:hypothetical protein